MYFKHVRKCKSCIYVLTSQISVHCMLLVQIHVHKYAGITDVSMGMITIHRHHHVPNFCQPPHFEHAVCVPVLVTVALSC